jgi:hypothetical protein
MSDKIARLGIERDNDLMYYIKNGDVWAVPRKQKGQPKGKPTKVAATGLEMDYSKYIYYLDGDGDVARKERALGGKAKKAKAPKVPKADKPRRAAAPVSNGKKKSEAQIAREVDECIAKVKGEGGAGAVSGARKRRDR